MRQNKPYFSIPIKENGESLAKLNEKDFVLSSEGNSHGKQITVREGVARLLLKAAKKLPKGYKFKIYDAWRSIQSQENMIKQFKERFTQINPTWNNERIEEEVFKFAAPVTRDPKKPPPHNTGGAVDLTITNTQGDELPMGYETNILTKRSRVNFYKDGKSPQEQRFNKNRLLLRKILTSVGFAPNDNEWWHFDYGNQRWAYYYKKTYAFYGEENAR